MRCIIAISVGFFVILANCHAVENQKAKKTKMVELTGKLRTGIVAIGGETTGTIIQTKDGAFELDFGKQKVLRQKAQKLNGKRVRVVGTLKIRSGVEIKKRKIVSVTHLEEAKSKQSAGLQGAWKMLKLESNGEQRPEEDFKDFKIIVKGDQLWLVKPTGADPKLKYTLDPEKKTIDLTVNEGDDKGKVVLGIYSLEKGQLRLCINIFGDPFYRPTGFVTYQGDGVAFATLEKFKTK